MTRTCPACLGLREFECRDDCFNGAGYLDGHKHPCSSCRGTGTEPLRDVTQDETEDALDALEADRSRLQAELDAVTVQRDWAMREMDRARETSEALHRVARNALAQLFHARTTESKASAPEVRGAVEGETE